MRMRLIMIRHGQSEWKPPRFVSLSQFRQETVAYDAAHLSDQGIRNIKALAMQLPQAPILSSNLLRAKETAEIIGRGRATIKFDSMFRELQAPTIAAHLLSKLQIPPTIWSLIHWGCWSAGIGICPEGPRAAWRRASQATNLILSSIGEEDTIILVSHGWFITLLTIYLRKHGLIERGPFLPQVGFGGMTEYHLRVA